MGKKIETPKFTKGKWQLSYYEHKYTIHKQDEPKEIIARLGGMRASKVTSNENEANGYLFTHSNELYAICEVATKALIGEKHKALRARMYQIMKKCRGPL